MLIRQLTELDAEQFWSLRLEALKNNPESFGASYDEEISIPMESHISHYINSIIAPREENIVLGAFDDEDKLIGIVGFRREKRQKLRHKGSIWGLYVDIKSRGGCVGKMLMLKVIEIARKMDGLEQLCLGVISSNEIAKNLYNSLGFEYYGTEINALKYDGVYYDEDLMVLYIQ